VVAISTSGARYGTLTFGKRVLPRSDRESFYYSSVEPLLEGGVLRREKVFAGAIPREHQ